MPFIVDAKPCHALAVDLKAAGLPSGHTSGMNDLDHGPQQGRGYTAAEC